MGQSQNDLVDNIGQQAATLSSPEPADLARRTATRLQIPTRLPMLLRAPASLPARLGALAILGGLAAACVGYLTSENPGAAPSGIAVSGRVVTISVLILTGIWGQTSGNQERMGRLLVLAGFLVSLWFLQGSRQPLAFSIGVLFSGVAAVLFCYLMLAHPTGRLRSRTERRFIGVVGGVALSCWVFAVLTSTRPPFSTAMIPCGPHCPSNRLYLGFTTGAVSALKVVILLSWVVLVAGTVLLLVRRMRSASPPARRMIAPVLLVAAAYLLALGGYLEAKSAAPHLHTLFGVAMVSVAVLVPLATGLGLISERLFMGQALQGFVNQLAGAVPLDLEARMSAALHDPSLRIAYRRPILGTYVDASGEPVAMPAPDDHHRATTEIKRADHPVAVVIHDAEMSDQARYVKAAGTAAMVWLENARLQADLRASLAELANSRSRLVETADRERRRIERDLHDGVQQHLVGTQIRLQMATETIRSKPEEAERILASISAQVDEALEELRALARGIYPSLLAEHGLGEALKSVGQRYATPVSVHADAIGRYRTDVETAVYFCCLEALQNAVKHGGPSVRTTVRLREQQQRLYLEVSDTGPGFTPEETSAGNGLANMRDRIEAVGGSLTVKSIPGHGATIRGVVPVASQATGTRARACERERMLCSSGGHRG